MKHRVLTVGLFLFAAPLCFAQDRVPGRSWSRYASPEEAGFSSEKLELAKAYYDTLEAAGAMVIYDGAVLAAWGDVERRFMCHSVRKSFMSALWGVHVDRGDVDLSKTLGDLGIDDLEPGLTDVEKCATILDLLKARSGVYRLAAYEPPENPKPPRHSHEPGTFWCYNNWDFNTLVTIIQQEVEADFFEDFGVQLAAPIGMQDYRPRDGYLHHEPEKSIHPAYPFRMSARDMARFGLLFLRRGHWGEREVLSEEWVDRSRTSYSDSWGGGGYGLLWWTEGSKDLKELGMYSALGMGGHAIDVLPGADLVLAFRVNTFGGNRVSGGDRATLLRKILAARSGEPAAEPKLEPLEEAPKPLRLDLSLQEKQAYVGEVDISGERTVRIYIDDDGILVAWMPGFGHFGLSFQRGDVFLVEDYLKEVELKRDEGGRVIDIVFGDGLEEQERRKVK